MRFFTVLSNPQRPAFYLIWLGWFIGGLLDIIDGLITVSTLAVFSTSFGTDWRFFICAMQCRNFDRKRLAEMKADDKPQPTVEE